MKFKDYSVRQVLVGLHRVGIVGLADAIERAEASGLDDRDALTDHMLATLRPNNYIPEATLPEYRRALWREYIRNRGGDFSALFSEVEVTVRGQPGENRDRFVDLVRSALAEMELQPVVVFEPGEGAGIELVIRGEVVARGADTFKRILLALRRTLSEW